MNGGGWQRHRVLEVLPNDTDTAHCVEVVPTSTVLYHLRATPRMKTKVVAWVRVTSCVREVGEKCVYACRKVLATIRDQNPSDY